MTDRFFKKKHGVTFLDNDEAEDAEVTVHDTASYRLSAPFSVPPHAETGVTFGQQQFDTSICQHTLLHGESLLVVAARDAHNVALRATKVKTEV